jgi:hypothetical protein
MAAGAGTAGWAFNKSSFLINRNGLSGTEGASGPFGADPSSLTNNAFQQMMSRNLSSTQNKKWSGEPLVPSREYPEGYVESAGGT